MKMWSGRFRKPLDPAFEKWQRSFGFDHRLLAYEVEASGAHARGLKSAGILTSDELISILKGLEEIGKRGAEDTNFLEDDEAEDVHHFVEKQLVAILGDTGYKLHSGRSRNEQIATDLRLFVRALNGPEIRRCRLIPICNEPNRCWWRIGCSLIWKCFCETLEELPIAESGSTNVRWDREQLREPRLRLTAEPWPVIWNSTVQLSIAWMRPAIGILCWNSQIHSR